jgi:hypothetical protein
MPPESTRFPTILAIAALLESDNIRIEPKLQIEPKNYKSSRKTTNSIRRLLLRIDPNQKISKNSYKSFRTTTNRSEKLQIDPNQYKSIRTTKYKSIQTQPHHYKLLIDPHMHDRCMRHAACTVLWYRRSVGGRRRHCWIGIWNQAILLIPATSRNDIVENG